MITYVCKVRNSLLISAYSLTVDGGYLRVDIIWDVDSQMYIWGNGLAIQPAAWSGGVQPANAGTNNAVVFRGNGLALDSPNQSRGLLCMRSRTNFTLWL